MLKGIILCKHGWKLAPNRLSQWGVSLVSLNRSFSSKQYLDSEIRDRNVSQFVVQYRNPLNHLFLSIAGNMNFTEKVTALSIAPNSWHSFLSGFRRKIIKEPELALGPDKLAEFCSLMDSTSFMQRQPESSVEEDADKKAVQYLFDLALSKAEIHFKDSIALHNTLCNMTDLRAPHEWYPMTRMRKRKVIYHGGPTNSGKTYQALERLKQADPEQGGGLYCGPLRLLALEVYESLNRSGIYCDLRTGQELREVPMSTHVSSTLEMVNLNKEYDVVVIDEIQMIMDAQRGYAWTKTVLGIQANEIHVCGGLEAYSIVQALMQQTQDDFQLCKYERMSTLVIDDKSLQGDYSSVRAGDCIVAFSRADIFAIKAEIEKLTPHKCAVIYGQLPSDIRSEQARLFNEMETGYDVLVASDAIGMGLNLNIGRIIFHTTVKRGRAGMVMADGSQAPSVYFVDPSNIKQIAGRAGRRSSQYQVGTVTAWQDSDLAYVRAVMQYDIPQIKAAGLFPSIEQIEEFSERLQIAAASASNLSATHHQSDEDENGDDEDDDFLDGALGSPDGGISMPSSSSHPGAVENIHYKSLLLSLVKEQSKSSKHIITYSTTPVAREQGFCCSVAVCLPDKPEQHFSSDAMEPKFPSKKAAERAAAQVAFKALGGKIRPKPDLSGTDEPATDGTTETTTTAVATTADANYIQLSYVLDRFLQLSKLDGGQYFMCNSSDIVLVSNWLHTIPMTLSERFVFSNAPVNTNDSLTMNQLYAFAASYAMKRPVGISMVLPTLQPRDLFEFSDLCVKHNILELYIWLSFRFPQFFVEQEACLVRREHTLSMIEATLMGSALKTKSSLKDDYLGLWKKLGTATGETYLPPDTDIFSAVRDTAAEYLEKLPSREPVFRDKAWGKDSRGSRKNASDRNDTGEPAPSRSFFSRVDGKTAAGGKGKGKGKGKDKSRDKGMGMEKEKEIDMPKAMESKTGLWKKTVPGAKAKAAATGKTEVDGKQNIYRRNNAKTRTACQADTFDDSSVAADTASTEKNGNSKLFARVRKTESAARRQASSANGSADNGDAAAAVVL